VQVVINAKFKGIHSAVWTCKERGFTHPQINTSFLLEIREDAFLKIEEREVE